MILALVCPASVDGMPTVSSRVSFFRKCLWETFASTRFQRIFRSVLEFLMQVLRNCRVFSSKDRIVLCMAWFQRLQLKQSENQSPPLSWLEEFRHLLYGYTNIDLCLCLSVEDPRVTRQDWSCLC